jgi:hypothetical protein
MAILSKVDDENYAYTLEYYLYEQGFDPNILEFMSNNNIQTNYVCFFDIIRSNIHYLVVKSKDCYQVISVLAVVASDNHIVNISDNVNIYYGECKISIFPNMSLEEAEKCIGVTEDDVIQYQTKWGNHKYDLEALLLEADTLRILSMPNLCQVLHCHQPIDISKFNMSKVFPVLSRIRNKTSKELIYDV